MFYLSYFTYITHCYSKKSYHKRASKEYQLDNTWDIFPKSHFFNLISGSINVHATHHVYPYFTRSELMTNCYILQEKYANNYRRIDTFQVKYKS
jgi:fatty acid desaturase